MLDKELKDFSPIKEFYCGKSILLTGATGLVGKALLYKILQSIEKLENVYVLIRRKKNVSAIERLNELVRNSRGMFDGFDSRTLEKLIPIESNLSSVGMDLSVDDRNTIVDKVSVIFHSAADVTFESKLKEQILINVGGTKEIIELCRQIKHLDALVYVSTAYSSPLQMVVTEKIYKSVASPIEILEIARGPIRSMRNEDYLGEYPNTYSYTKNLSENLINDEFAKEYFPVTIVRPGIVLNSYKEPRYGWFNSITSLMGLFVMLGSGLSKIVNIKREITLDVIPVDIVANTCIASAQRLSSKSSKRKLVVYNCNSSCLGAISFGKCLDIMTNTVKQYPFLYTLRPGNHIWTDDDFLANRFSRFILETCFAYIVDVFLLLNGQKQIAVKKLRLYHSMMRAIKPYTRQWYFTNDNMVRLFQQLSDCDKIAFNCDIPAIDWISYYKDLSFPIRSLLLKEKDEDIERAQRNIKYIRSIYTIINYMILLLLWYMFVKWTPITAMFSNAFEMLANLGALSLGFYAILCSIAIQLVFNFI